MEENMKDPLLGVRISHASQLGMGDESISYSSGPVNNDKALEELAQNSRTLTEIAEKSLKTLTEMSDTLSRLYVICMNIGISLSSLEERLSSLENIKSVSTVRWGQKQDQARQLLKDLLSDNPKGVEVKQIMSEASMKGISMQTVRRTKRIMGLKAEKRGTSWLWKWPEGQEPVTTGGE